MAWHGASRAEIAQYFEISERQFYAWCHTYAPFKEAIEIRNENADKRVEASLYQKAIGGDNTAIIFWLKNRMSAIWRDRHEIDATAALQLNMDDPTKMAQSVAMLFATALQSGQDPAIDVTPQTKEQSDDQHKGNRVSGPLRRDAGSGTGAVNGSDRDSPDKPGNEEQATLEQVQIQNHSVETEPDEGQVSGGGTRKAFRLRW